MIYVIVVVCYTILLWLFDPSGWVQNKIFDRKISNIKHCCRLNNDEQTMNIVINNSSKSYSFDISICEENHNSISTITPYTSSSVCINGTKVCTIHRLRKAFHISRVIEYSDNHNIDEVDRIIKQASKDAKKRIDEYYSISNINRDSNKSLFN